MEAPPTDLDPVLAGWRHAIGRWQRWFVSQAFPLWSERGIDPAGGGFFEKLDARGDPLEEPRRTRVVARQLYVCAAAPRLGWQGDTLPLLRHGLGFLMTRLQRPDGCFANSFDVRNQSQDPTFDLYEQAFGLFAMASVFEANRLAFQDLPERAQATMGCLRAGWQHPLGGFHEDIPPRAPLRANPHMHLLEAALQWLRVDGGRHPGWGELADDIVALALARLIDASSGLVTEWFDLSWQPAAGALGTEAEPGHQFEWGWLLLQWARARAQHPRRAEAVAAAHRMIELGERLGVDPARSVALNAIGTDGRWRDASAKLWPQTERIKAWVACAESADSPEQAARALATATQAVQSLSDYLDHPLPGAWHEAQDEHGAWQAQATRASSLYHIVYALETALSAQLPPKVNRSASRMSGA